jgi:cytochrome c biogenesis factor
LWLALLLGAWGASLALAGALTGRRDLTISGERGVHAATFFTVLAMVGLGWALAVGDLTYRYVATWASYSTPLPYRIGAIWAGPSGALMLWAFALGAGGSIAAVTQTRGTSLRAWTVALVGLMLLAVLAMACFEAHPFARLTFPPTDGRGVPLEWMRPVALVQMPVGYVAMALVSIPSVIAVMGALGNAAWREPARRWAMLCWALLGAAMLLDWRRRYGDAAWAADWAWAPVHDGTALAWAGTTLLIVAASRPWSTGASLFAGFQAFTLALSGLTLRRAQGWDGVHEFAASAAGRAIAWLALAAVIAVVVEQLRALRGTRGLAARAWRVSLVATLVAALALTGAGMARAVDVGVNEGEQARVTDRFGMAWTLSLEGVSRVGREEVVSTVLAVRAAVAGRARGYVTAEVRTLFARTTGQPVAEEYLSGIAAGLLQDLRVDVRDVDGTTAVLSVRFVPVASWLWVAGGVAVLAALLVIVAGPAGVVPTMTAPVTSDDATAVATEPA